MNALRFSYPGGMSVARDADEFLCVLRRLSCGHLTKAQAKEYRKLWPALLEVRVEPMQWPGIESEAGS